MRKLAFLFVLALSFPLFSQVNTMLPEIGLNGRIIPATGSVELEMMSLSEFQLKIPYETSDAGIPTKTSITVSFPGWESPVYQENVQQAKSLSREFQVSKVTGDYLSVESVVRNEATTDKPTSGIFELDVIPVSYGEMSIEVKIAVDELIDAEKKAEKQIQKDGEFHPEIMVYNLKVKIIDPLKRYQTEAFSSSNAAMSGSMEQADESEKAYQAYLRKAKGEKELDPAGNPVIVMPSFEKNKETIIQEWRERLVNEEVPAETKGVEALRTSDQASVLTAADSVIYPFEEQEDPFSDEEEVKKQLAKSFVPNSVTQGQAMPLAVSTSDSLALVALYYATDGVNWYNDDNWLSGPVSSWFGVIVDGDYVTHLMLGYNGLSGTIPPEIGDLSSLLFLDLQSNNLSGDIPAELYDMNGLSALYLGYNNFNGISIPDIGLMTNLQNLSLDNMGITGAFPAELLNLTNLATLSLNSNEISSIPAELSNLTNLTNLALAWNQITGSILSEIFELTSLTYLDLSGNQITGGIPSEIGNLINLQYLFMTYCGLEGNIPEELYDLTLLRYLYLGSNQFSGSISSNIGNLNNLLNLNLSSNILTGPLPAELFNLSQLIYLRLSYNQLTGSISSNVGNLSNVGYLNLSGNNLSGPIPDELYNLANLYYLNLSGNQISGSISGNIANLNNLERLYLYANQLEGPLPAELYLLPSLRDLYMGYNSLISVNFAALGQMPFLNSLGLEGMGLTEGMVTGLANSSTLRYLYLSDNLFTSIPDEICNITSLENLDLAFNQLSGPINENVGNLTNLTRLYLYYNQLDGALPSTINNIPNLSYTGLQSNLLDDLPSLTGKTESWSLYVFDNELSFEDLEPNIGVPDYFNYAPQAEIGEEISVNLNAGDSYTFNANCGGSNNQYQWYRNGEMVPGAQAASLTISDVTYENSGDYQCHVTNTTVPDLTISTRPVHILMYNPLFEQDSLALVAFYNATSGPGWWNQGNWLTGPVSTWEGVSLQYGRVTELWLGWNNMQGSIPPEIGDLTELQQLDLYDSQLTGGVPLELFNLTNLISLELSYLDQNGPIPTEIGQLVNLEQLSLNWNSFTGSIPDELFSLTNLRWLFISGNDFGGSSLPASIGNLTNLEGLNLEENGFGGDIPAELALLTNLYDLSIGYNSFTNLSNFDIGGMTNLGYLNLSGMDLQGQMPSNMADLNNLWGLYLRENMLTNIPSEVFQITSLASLYLDNNQIAGPISPDISNLANLYSLNLTDNQLSSIPEELFILTSLESLHLGYNQLSGSISSSISNLSNLRYLSLEGNQFESIPSELFALSNLQSLNMGGNQLSGDLPTEIGNLFILESLQLYGNQFSSIPDELYNLTSLYDLGLGSNLITGAIPVEINQLTQLSSLDLAYNQIEDLPVLSGLTNLYQLYVQYNKLTFEDIESNIGIPIDYFRYWGQLPIGAELFENMTEGQDYTMNISCGGDHNSYQWYKDGSMIPGAETDEYTITAFTLDDQGDYYCEVTNSVALNLTIYSNPIHLDIYTPVSEQDSLALVALYNATNGPGWNDNGNWLSGPVSSWYGVYIENGRVTALYLDGNNLVGDIPPEIGNLDNLRDLYLSSNNLTGELPVEFFYMAELRYLNLRYNQLSGDINPAIAQLSNLEGLYLRYNNFTGILPDELFSLTGLYSLDISANNFSGNLPGAIENLSNLGYFSMYRCGLTGDFPSEFYTLPNLYFLEVSYNTITLDFTLLGQMNSIEYLYMGETGITGPIPVELTNLSNLRYLGLWSNQINSLPIELFSMSSLSYINLDGNLLSGEIPTDFNTMSNLTDLDLGGNEFSTVADEFFNMPSMFSLDLSENQITGPLPSSIEDLSSITRLYLSNNMFTGAIPVEIGALTTLERLYLYYNQFSGDFPYEINSCEYLQNLVIANNNLSGLPDLSGMGSLSYMNVEYNNLDFGDLENANVDESQVNFYYYNQKDLELSRSDDGNDVTLSFTADGTNNQNQWFEKDNMLSGQNNAELIVDINSDGGYYCEINNPDFPALTLYTAIEEIGDGGITNGVPDAEYDALVALYNATNGPAWTNNTNWMSDESVFEWFGIQRAGIHVSSIYLYDNNLEGIIPAEIAGLSQLQLINFGGNQIIGGVPVEISNLTDLWGIFLYRNQISDVPDLTASPNLEYISVSENQLTFEDLEPNIGVANYEIDYLMQANIGEEQWITLNQGEDHTLSAVCGGSANVYKWFKDGVNIPGAILADYQITVADVADAGTYHCEVSNTIATGLIISSNPIHVDVNECSLPPDWVVNPADYAFNGQVNAKVYVHDVPVEAGYLAAFVGDECRGIVEANFFDPANHYLFGMLCYSNEASGETLTFKYFDFAGCEILEPFAEAIDFESDMIIGDAFNPFELHYPGNVQFTKGFQTGWNWFSVNVVSDDMSLGNLLTCASTDDYIKNQLVSATYYDDYGWFGDLEELNTRELYKIKAVNPCDADFAGMPAVMTDIPIEAGWNWIGYQPQQAIPIGDALESLTLETDDYIKNQTVSSTYYADFGWFGDLEDLGPTDGFMLKKNTAGTLTYPESAPPLAQEKSAETILDLNAEGINPSQFEYSGSVTAKVFVDGELAGSDKDLVMAYVDGQLRGVSKGLYFDPANAHAYPLMIFSNVYEGEEVSFKYYDAESELLYRCDETLSFFKDMVEANAYESFELHVNSALGIEDMAGSAELTLDVYPNPFSNHLQISYSIAERSKVRIAVYDVLGKEVEIIEEMTLDQGTYSTVWNAESYAVGTYYIKLITKEESKIKKIVLFK